MGGSTGVTPALRWFWATGTAAFLVGVLAFRVAPQGALLVAELGLVLMSVAGGITAARGSTVGATWNLLAWLVPALPVLAALAVFAWLQHERSDPLGVAVLLVLASAATITTWAVFAVALVVELVLRRRRRFGAPRPAWENDPTPPPYS